MDLNATLIGQIITFAIFVWFTMKFVWPQLEQALQARKKIIADGLAAAEKGQQDLMHSKQAIKKQLTEARERANTILDQANKQAALIIEQAKTEANAERASIVAAGNKQLQQDLLHVKAQLQEQISELIVSSAGKLLARDINEKDHEKWLYEL